MCRRVAHVLEIGAHFEGSRQILDKQIKIYVDHICLGGEYQLGFLRRSESTADVTLLWMMATAAPRKVFPRLLVGLVSRLASDGDVPCRSCRALYHGRH